MKVGIHGHPNRTFDSYITRYETICQHNGIETLRLDASDAGFWEQLRECDAFIYRWGHGHDADRLIASNILPVVEQEYECRLFPNWQTCWHFDNKIAQYYLLNARGFPFADSWVFFDLDSALAWASTAPYPVVAKLSGGASSNNVALIRNRREAEKLILRLFRFGIASGRLNLLDRVNSPEWLRTVGAPLKRAVLNRLGQVHVAPRWNRHQHYALFQRYLPDNAFDMRIVVVGNRALGYRRFQREGDFRASGSGLKDLNPVNIDLACVKTAFEVSDSFGFQSMAYDFFYDESRNPSILEISYSIPELAFQNVPGHWDRGMNWHPGHLWPQYCQLSDLLERPDLRQPEMPFEIKWDTLADGQLLHPGITSRKPDGPL